VSSAAIGNNVVPLHPEATEPQQQVPTDLNELRALIQQDFNAAVADVERRLAQARELERSAAFGTPRQIHAEDLNLSKFMIDGYTLTANSPANGSIAWANLHLVFQGVDYTITAANTALKYTYFVKPASYTPGTNHPLVSSNTKPVLGPNDALVFVNNVVGGMSTPISVLETSIPYAIGDGVVSDAEVSSLSQAKITGLSGALNTFTTDIQRVEAKADGAITQWIQPDFPWANGTVQGTEKTGDVYTAQGSTDQVARPDGRSWKWSGPSGAPANNWILIADSDVAKALADSAAAKNGLAGKNTSYYRTMAQGAPPTPTDGFATGDEWVQTDNANYTQRWTGSAWTAVLYGDAALSGISGGKVGSGINGDNVTTGTVVAARVGAGVNGAVLTTATGQVVPSKLNIPVHMLY
jgi:hypothetical protein